MPNQKGNKNGNEKEVKIIKEILKSIKTKNILLKHFLRNKDRLIYLRYKAYREKLRT